MLITKKNILLKLKSFLYGETWPAANDPEYEANCDFVKKAFLDSELTNRTISKNEKFLDYGCGNGNCISTIAQNYDCKCFGYDIFQHENWANLENINFTNSYEELMSSGPYDVVMINDVLDDVRGESPVVFLNKISSVTSADAEFYVRCCPWISISGNEICTKLNKAFVHLVFTEEELNDIDPLVSNHRFPITTPIKTYANYFEKSKLKIVYAKKTIINVDQFFKNNFFIRDRIIENTKCKEFPEYQMSIKFIDYLLVKNYKFYD